MKILIATPLYPPDIGGPATYSKVLEDALPKNGIEVDVFSFGSVKHLPKVLRHAVYFFKIFKKGKNTDLILALDPVSVGLPAALAARILRKKFFIKIVGDYAWEQGVQRFGVKEALDDFLEKKYGFWVEFFRKVEKFVVHRAVKVIVPSNYLKKIVAKWGISEDKSFVVYNAVELPREKISKDEARKQLGLSGKIIVSAGREVPWKGFDTLRNLMPEISKKFLDAKLLILTKEPKEKLLLYLTACDVFVLNTAYEGLSHQILEAMAMGAPIVTTDVGGNPELIENGDSGFLVKFNEKEALVDKISTLLSNAELSQKFSENAQRKAREFTHERMIKETINILKQ